jgi:predicted ribosome quality control (RQC) complex YloA/Tae2 family protein
LDTVTAYTSNIDEFQQALAHIEGAATTRMPNVSEEALKTPRKHAPSGSKSVFSPALKLKPSKSLDLPPALQDALRHANISYNQDSLEYLLESMSKVQLEREKKLQDHYDSASSSVHSTLAERLSRADGDLKTILKGLYSHTPFQQVHLTDPKLDNELKRMEKELDEAEDQLLSAETNELSLSDPKVRAFIAKYG